MTREYDGRHPVITQRIFLETVTREDSEAVGAVGEFGSGVGTELRAKIDSVTVAEIYLDKGAVTAAVT